MVQFELLKENKLGEGQSGEVFQCYWGDHVAVAKVYNIVEAEETADILQEIEVIKKLHNTNIAECFGTARHDGRLCVITCYAEKGSLRQALAYHAVPNAHKSSIITGLINGMQYLKLNGVIHQGLKSPNVLLDSDYVPKICDIGLAHLKLISASHAVSPASDVKTTRWMAPELFEIQPRYSFASEVYALGVVIWEILTEQLPYEGTENDIAIVECIRSGQHPVIPDDVPAHYISIIKHCWHFKPEGRISIEQIGKENKEVLPWTDAASVDGVFGKVTLPNMRTRHHASNPLSFLQMGFIREPEPAYFTNILNQYLLHTTGNKYAKDHLGAICSEHGDAFTRWVKATAMQGNDAAVTVLGEMHYHGCGVEQNYRAAFEQFSMAAGEGIPSQNDLGVMQLSMNTTKQGNARAQCNLGLMYLYGQGAQRNADKAAEWLSKAAEQDNANARFELGWMYEKGDGAPQNNDKAIELYTIAADQGYCHAQYYLGWLYENGIIVEQSHNKAVEWYTKAADQDNAHAQFSLGWMYQTGKGVPQNYGMAFELYKKAAEQGIEDAQFRLSKMYENTPGVSQSNDREVEWHRISVRGQTSAKNNLARMYKKHQVYPQSEEKLVEWYQRAESGDAIAQCNLAWMYKSGTGVPQSDANAVEWYAKAADQGLAEAQLRLGWMYANGHGVLKNYDKAVALYMKAATQGNADAQNNLGWMYANGLGVPKSDDSAFEWYTKAAEQGSASANCNLQLMQAEHGHANH